MPHIETVEELTDQIADWLGIYGACKSDDSSRCENENPLCCRIGFRIIMEERIHNAVDNEKKLEQLDLK